MKKRKTSNYFEKSAVAVLYLISYLFPFSSCRLRLVFGIEIIWISIVWVVRILGLLESFFGSLVEKYCSDHKESKDVCISYRNRASEKIPLKSIIELFKVLNLKFKSSHCYHSDPSMYWKNIHIFSEVILIKIIEKEKNELIL